VKTLAHSPACEAGGIEKSRGTFRAMLQQQHSIGDNSRRDFCQPAKSHQAIAGNSRRAMLQQKHSIDANRRRAMLQQHDSTLRFHDSLILNDNISFTFSRAAQ